VIMKESKEGLMEPIEKVEIECNAEHMSGIIDNLTNRKGMLMDSKQLGNNRELLFFSVPSRGLIGFRAQLIGDTRGSFLV